MTLRERIEELADCGTWHPNWVTKTEDCTSCVELRSAITALVTDAIRTVILKGMHMSNADEQHFPAVAKAILDDEGAGE